MPIAKYHGSEIDSPEFGPLIANALWSADRAQQRRSVYDALFVLQPEAPSESFLKLLSQFLLLRVPFILFWRISLSLTLYLSTLFVLGLWSTHLYQFLIFSATSRTQRQDTAQIFSLQKHFTLHISAAYHGQAFSPYSYVSRPVGDGYSGRHVLQQCSRLRKHKWTARRAQASLYPLHEAFHLRLWQVPSPREFDAHVDQDKCNVILQARPGVSLSASRSNAGVPSDLQLRSGYSFRTAHGRRFHGDDGVSALCRQL